MSYLLSYNIEDQALKHNKSNCPPLYNVVLIEIGRDKYSPRIVYTNNEFC